MLITTGHHRWDPPGVMVRTVSRAVVVEYRKTLPWWIVYHNLDHVRRTVAAVETIGRRSGLSATDLDLVRIAAWFHDIGYRAAKEGHEQRSASAATRFLRLHGVSRRDIERIGRCILATRMPQRPRTLLEKVLCDADMVSLGTTDFFMLDRRLKRETERREGRRIPDADWLARSARLLSTHRFHSPYGRTTLERGQRKNLKLIREYLQEDTFGRRPKKSRHGDTRARGNSTRKSTR